jgi:hypothetical protein
MWSRRKSAWGYNEKQASDYPELYFTQVDNSQNTWNNNNCPWIDLPQYVCSWNSLLCEQIRPKNGPNHSRFAQRFTLTDPSDHGSTPNPAGIQAFDHYFTKEWDMGRNGHQGFNAKTVRV